MIPTARDTDSRSSPAQQTQHYLTLAPGREPTPTAAPGGHAGRHRVSVDAGGTDVIARLIGCRVNGQMSRRDQWLSGALTIGGPLVVLTAIPVATIYLNDIL